MHIHYLSVSMGGECECGFARPCSSESLTTTIKQSAWASLYSSLGWESIHSRVHLVIASRTQSFVGSLPEGTLRSLPHESFCRATYFMGAGYPRVSKKKGGGRSPRLWLCNIRRDSPSLLPYSVHSRSSSQSREGKGIIGLDTGGGKDHLGLS